MNWLWYIYGAAGLMVAWWLIRAIPRRKLKRARTVPCQIKRMLFSPEEQALFAVLKGAVGDEFEIFAKIRASDILSPHRGAGRREAGELYQSMAGRRFTFVLCHKADLSVAGIVELAEHGAGRKAQDTDDPVALLCHAAGLPLIRIPASPYYDAGEIARQVMDEIRREPAIVHGDGEGGRIEPRISNLEDLKF
ncbi:DUF2726 domain-containing protein [Methylococcus geothermalis]|uniref:DUF2726 domain-containing protein n=1 Tax=Methylococcus geothermalis TaxID=2681310 RepID=A0A858Q7S0_9GAMM|nr:DUF2726 domain-containing protein [Methylococcus geothermalis]QJD29845.1 DUF2726 domain-containing protein [Methylococcus geothermalis]